MFVYNKIKHKYKIYNSYDCADVDKDVASDYSDYDFDFINDNDAVVRAIDNEYYYNDDYNHENFTYNNS